MEHKVTLKASDDRTQIWGICPCGWESAYYTWTEEQTPLALEEEALRHMSPRVPEYVDYGV